MKAISLWQPWASALFAPRNPGPGASVCVRVKNYETRHWPMPRSLIGQRVAIHAAKRDTRDEKEFWMDCVIDTPKREFYGHAFGAIGVQNYNDLPRGAIIGTVVLGPSIRTDGHRWSEDEVESSWGNFSMGRFAWPVSEPIHFSNPIPCVGRQGFFEWSPP